MQKPSWGHNHIISMERRSERPGRLMASAARVCALTGEGGKAPCPWSLAWRQWCSITPLQVEGGCLLHHILQRGWWEGGGLLGGQTLYLQSCVHSRSGKRDTEKERSEELSSIWGVMWIKVQKDSEVTFWHKTAAPALSPFPDDSRSVELMDSALHHRMTLLLWEYISSVTGMNLFFCPLSSSLEFFKRLTGMSVSQAHTQ